jgi:hypothetical protein
MVFKKLVVEDSYERVGVVAHVLLYFVFTVTELLDDHTDDLLIELRT